MDGATVILHQISPTRAADAVDLTDLTDATRTESARWVECEEHGSADCLLIGFDTDPDDNAQAAIRRRLVVADDADEARLNNLLELRAAANSPFEIVWLDTELGKYGI
jgi:hypothetical protein